MTFHKIAKNLILSPDGFVCVDRSILAVAAATILSRVRLKIHAVDLASPISAPRSCDCNSMSFPLQDQGPTSNPAIVLDRGLQVQALDGWCLEGVEGGKVVPMRWSVECTMGE